MLNTHLSNVIAFQCRIVDNIREDLSPAEKKAIKQTLRSLLSKEACSICRFPGHDARHCWLTRQMWQATHGSLQLEPAWYRVK